MYSIVHCRYLSRLSSSVFCPSANVTAFFLYCFDESVDFCSCPLSSEKKKCYVWIGELVKPIEKKKEKCKRGGNYGIICVGFNGLRLKNLDNCQSFVQFFNFSKIAKQYACKKRMNACKLTVR